MSPYSSLSLSSTFWFGRTNSGGFRGNFNEPKPITRRLYLSNKSFSMLVWSKRILSPFEILLAILNSHSLGTEPQGGFKYLKESIDSIGYKLKLMQQYHNGSTSLLIRVSAKYSNISFFTFAFIATCSSLVVS